jgi:hypothetical protein
LRAKIKVRIATFQNVSPETAFRRKTRRETAMLAEIKDPVRTRIVKDPGTQFVTSTVEVIAGDPPAFRFPGLEKGRNATITHEEADFTLTLQNPPTGFPEGSRVTFVPLVTVPAESPTDGPITWLTPGTLEPIARPHYIKAVELPEPTALAFSLTNPSRPDHDVVVSFVVNVVVTVPDQPDVPLSSPDPTIINVDPPDLETAGDCGIQGRTAGGRTRVG